MVSHIIVYQLYKKLFTSSWKIVVTSALHCTLYTEVIVTQGCKILSYIRL